MTKVPAPAAAVGYDIETFGPNVTIGSNWFGSSGDGATQNADGSVTIASPTNNTYNAQLGTWDNGLGEAFSGGGYIQATLSWSGSYNGSSGWPSFWSGDVGKMNSPSLTNWVEPDFMEYWANNRYGTAIHNWYGVTGSGQNVSTNIPQFTLPSGVNPSQPNTYGFLWVPSTSTSQGYAKWFFDGQEIGSVYWNSYASNPSPNSNPYGIMDVAQLGLILGTGANSMTVNSVEVWQASAANDVFKGVPTPTPTPAATPSANDAVVMAGSSAAITDRSGNKWTITGGGQVAVNGTADATTSRVIELAYVNGAVWQENTDDIWWDKTSPTAAWSPNGGTATSPLPATVPPVATGSGANSIVLNMAEDAWQGDAQFTVKVDGTQVGGTQTVSALKSSGDSEVFLLAGNWAAGTHTVQIAFINDAYGGTSTTDRNLYVNSIAYNGTTYSGTSAPFLGNGSQNFTVGGTTPSASAAADTLTLNLSEDAWNGNAQFTLTIDGKRITTSESVTGLHTAGAWEAFSFTGNFGAGSHTVGVTFTNDAYGGTTTSDRNLYVNGIDVNGQHYGSGVTSLMSNGAASFNIVTDH